MPVRSWAAIALAAAFAVACQVPPKPPPPTAPPAITAFTASKTAIVKGETVSFTFSAQRATSVTLVDQAGVAVATTFDAASGSGSATASPASSSFYVLRATGEGGIDSAFVQVAVDEGLKSVFLAAVPGAAKPGDLVTIIWQATGGRNISVRAGTRTLGTAETGAVTEPVAATTTYTLTATKADGTALTASATVKVAPLIVTLVASPPVAPPGGTITVSWSTLGADEVALSEATFGALTTASGPTAAAGSYAFTVPTSFGDAGVPDADGGAVDAGPGPQPVRDNYALRFTLTARTTAPAQSVSRAIDGRVGVGPSIDSLDAPATLTEGRPLTVRWVTSGASRVELYVGGQRLYAPPAGQRLSASYTLPAVVADTLLRLVAYDFTGLSVEKSQPVRVVKAPAIGAFTLPATVASPTAAATASWRTTNATALVLRFKGGPVVLVNTLPNQVTQGTAPVHVPSRTTFVLEAYNAANDKATAEQTVDVTAPLTIGASPDPAAAGTPVTLSWDVSSLAPADLPGLPNPAPQTTPTSTNFDDLDTLPAATTLYFANRDDGVAAFDAPAGFTFPFLGLAASRFYASTNGFLSLVPTAALSSNPDLSAAGYSGPPALAPFWADLDLGTAGSVKYFASGDAFPRKLVVQWSDVVLFGTTDTRLTFQVQLWETGKFTFNYKTLTGPGADGSLATVGAVAAPGLFQGQFSQNTAAVAPDLELLWFANDASRVTSVMPLAPTASTLLGFFVQTGAGALIPAYTTVRVFSADSVRVNEVMAQPDPAAPLGQWVELRNPSAQAVDVTGLQLASTSAPAAPYTFPPGSVVPAGGYLVAGQSTDPGQNGGAPVTLAWGAAEVPLTATDGVTLQVGSPDGGAAPFLISSLAWPGPALPDGGASSGPAVSAQAPEAARGVGGAALVCGRSVTYGTPPQVGTPGAENETCFEYRLSAIAGNFEDVSASAPGLFAATTDDGTVAVPLPAPFSSFGAPRTTLSVCTNGWLSLTPTTSTAYGNPSSLTATLDPLGALAPFWDDLKVDKPTNPAANVFVGRVADHTIVQWHHVTHLSAGDDLNFEVKLFDSGAIEYHYGAMTSGSASNYGNGNSATVWLSRPAPPEGALTVSVNQATVVPNSAWRFTPVR